MTTNVLLSGLKHWTWLHTLAASLEGYAFPRLEWILISLIICIVGLLLASRKRSTKRTSCTLSPDAVRALSVIFTPSSGGWSYLVTRFRQTRTSPSAQLIQLDLSELLENIFSGNVELRVTGDLSNLLRGPLYIYDFSITLSVTRHWWFIAAKWMVLQQFHMSPIQATSCHSEQFTYDLDHIPCHRIEREVLRIQGTHSSGTTFSIEFTCVAPGITIVSPCYILCLIPSLYASRNRYRTSKKNSLTLSLKKVISWLSNDFATILSATNTSSEQAAILCGREKDMIHNCNLRSQLVSDEGLVGWRRKRFMLLWEAGLLSAGLLFRWRIILKAN